MAPLHSTWNLTSWYVVPYWQTTTSVCLTLHTVAVCKYTSTEEILFTAMYVGKQKTSLVIFSRGHLIPGTLGDAEYDT